MSPDTTSPIDSYPHPYGPSTPWPYQPADVGVDPNLNATPGWADTSMPSGPDHYPPFIPPDTPDYVYDHELNQDENGDANYWGEYSSYEDDPTLTPSTSRGNGPHSFDSPVLVSPERASDYAKMSMSSATPPPSNASVTTYMSRFVKLVKKIHELPWVAKDRATVDYYPDNGKRSGKKGRGKDPDDLYDRRNMHVTAVSWKSKEYIAWRQSHYGHLAGSSGSASVGASSPYNSLGGTTMSPDSEAGIIEPFPFTSTDNGHIHS